MAIFDYKGLSLSDSVSLMETSKTLAVHGNISGILGLPTETIIQDLGNLLSSGMSSNEIDVTLPKGWEESTPKQLSMPEDSLDSWGFFPIESPLTGNTVSGAQVKILEHRGEKGQIDQLSVVFAGTNSPVDVVDYFQINENTIAPNMNPLLEKVKDYALANGLTGEDVLVTGYSLGGGMTNIMAKNRADLADGFFTKSSYVGHESPYIYDNQEVVFNVGYENDVVHRIIGDEVSVTDAIDAASPGLVNPDSYFSSSTDNLILFDDVYASPLWNISPFSILNIPLGWAAHASGIVTDAVSRIGNSSYYEFTHQDSAVVVDNLSALKRWNTWVGDKESSTSDHFDKPTFVIGTEYNDLLFGNAGGDYIDAGAGNDKIKLGTGIDRLDGGEGQDTVMLEGSSSDWAVYRCETGEYFINNLNGNDLKQVENMEKIEFIDNGNSHKNSYDLFEFANYNSGNENTLYGTADNDTLKGETIFAGKGNDMLTATLSSNALLHGGEGDDTLCTDAVTSSLYGAEGDDTLIVNEGSNYLSGGVGNDCFSFSGHNGFNIISDFNSYSGDNDSIEISNVLFDGASVDVEDCITAQGDDVVFGYNGFNLTVENTCFDDVLTAIEII